MNSKEVDNEYLRNKILNNENERIYIKKVGKVSVRVLKDKEEVTTYFYDECSQIKTYKEKVVGDDKMLITKHINGKEYNSIIPAVSFYKSYYQNANKEYLPVVDYMIAYIINEPICFLNVWGQGMKMKEGDILLATDAKLLDFYGIYKYNFDDNYEVVNEPTTVKKRKIN